MASIHETAEGPPRRRPDEPADNAQIRRDVSHAHTSSEAQANPRPATQRGSEPLLVVNFSDLLFSVIVRTTLSGTPARTSASVSRVTRTDDPRSPMR